MEKAKEIADKLGKPNFTGSRGWLDKWKKRFNVNQLKFVENLVTLKVQLLIHGRSVCQKLSVATRKTTSGTWTRRVCFGEHCQTKVLVKNPNNVKEGKKKQRLTIAFL